MSQATTLNALFHSLAGWALNHVKEGGNPAYFETCMRLALKAQSQSRATNETLAEIKNPPVVFTRQANIVNGPQQINHGVRPSSARENEIPQSELRPTMLRGPTICDPFIVTLDRRLLRRHHRPMRRS